ncbi:MAG: rRNA maturation RNase YbeY [Actinomycetota bacterium]|nr:rRNA maturation RNase YbeY [Actinomycetota bacterium]
MSADDSGKPSVFISDRQTRSIDEDGLRELAERTLVGEGKAVSELSVSFVAEAEIADLHGRYLHEEGPTDVLSFPLEDVDDGVAILGDVVIAPEVAARNNPDVEAELRLLLVHGILHLLGHDHEDETERAVMWERQERYTGIRVP